ncbi:MAG: cytochrome ubiquinol oxidase subunit I, partial [Alloprevotella sp.]|nr:cytochrome ubiquinol oxidase subunit I [Alloprevotella sp.]
EAHIDYFGYGYIQKAEDLVPPVWLVYWSFRLMVGLGSFLMLFLILAWWMQRKGTLENARWMHLLGLAAIPMVYMAGQAGWIVAEVGRQPWAIQDLLPVNAAVSQISPSGVITTFVLFLVVFTVLLAAEVKIMCKAIKEHQA